MVFNFFGAIKNEFFLIFWFFIAIVYKSIFFVYWACILNYWWTNFLIDLNAFYLLCLPNFSEQTLQYNVVGLFRFTISSWFGVGSACLSRNLFILSRLPYYFLDTIDYIIFFISVRLVVIFTLLFLIPSFLIFINLNVPSLPTTPMSLPTLKKIFFVNLAKRWSIFKNFVKETFDFVFILFIDHTSLFLCGSHYFCWKLNFWNNIM